MERRSSLRASPATALRGPYRHKERIPGFDGGSPATFEQVGIDSFFRQARQLGIVRLLASSLAIVTKSPARSRRAILDKHARFNIPIAQTCDFRSAFASPKINHKDGPVAQADHRIGRNGSKEARNLFLAKRALL